MVSYKPKNRLQPVWSDHPHEQNQMPEEAFKAFATIKKH